MATSQYIPLELPFKGLHQGTGDESIPTGFTSGQHRNMRPRDWRAGGKRRMATRPGLSRFIAAPVPGGSAVQGMAAIDLNANLGDSARGEMLYEDTFARADTASGSLGDFDGGGNDWTVVIGDKYRGLPTAATQGHRYSKPYVSGLAARVRAGHVVDDRTEVAGTDGVLSACINNPSTVIPPPDNYSIVLEYTHRSVFPSGLDLGSFVALTGFSDSAIAIGGALDGAFMAGVRLLKTAEDGIGSPEQPFAQMFFGRNSGTDTGSLQPTTPNTSVGRIPFISPEQIGLPDFPPVPFGPVTQAFVVEQGGKHTIEMRVNGRRVDFFYDGLLVFIVADFSAVTGQANTIITPGRNRFGFVLSSVGSGSSAMIVSVDRFAVYRSSVASTKPRTVIIAASGGTLSASTGSRVAPYIETPAVLMSNSEVTIVPGPGPSASSSQGAQYAYLLDGSVYKKIRVSTGEVTDWTATAGAMPANSLVQSQRARYGISWNGSLVWYGVIGSEDAFGMTRQFDWNDFNETPVFSLLNGKEAFSATVPENISSIFPLGDTALGIASRNRLFVMTSRLTLGGTIAELSDRTGVVGPRAWAVDNLGNIHIVHLSGHWVIGRGGGAIQQISKGRMDKFFGDIDLGLQRVVCVWSNAQDGLHVFVTSSADPEKPVDHLFWDRQEDHYCIDTLPPRINPTALAVVNDETGRDRVVLAGSDGIIRAIDPDSESDDGTDIDSVMDFTAITAGGLDRMILGGIELRMGDDEGSGTIEIRSSRSVPLLKDATPRVSRRFGPGEFVRRINARVGGSAVGLRIRGPRFSVERARILVEPGGSVDA